MGSLKTPYFIIIKNPLHLIFYFYPKIIMVYIFTIGQTLSYFIRDRGVLELTYYFLFFNMISYYAIYIGYSELPSNQVKLYKLADEKVESISVTQEVIYWLCIFLFYPELIIVQLLRFIRFLVFSFINFKSTILSVYLQVTSTLDSIWRLIIVIGVLVLGALSYIPIWVWLLLIFVLILFK